LGSDESQDQDRYGNEEDDDKKADISDGETWRRITVSANVGRALILDRRSGKLVNEVVTTAKPCDVSSKTTVTSRSRNRTEPRTAFRSVQIRTAT